MSNLPIIPSPPNSEGPYITRLVNSLRDWASKIAAEGGYVTRTSVGQDVESALSDGAAGYLFDSTIPPQLENLVVTGAFRVIILEWDAPRSRIGYVEIWRAEVDDLGMAVKIDTTEAGMYADTPEYATLSKNYYYWIRAVSRAEISGPYNATAGTVGHTANDPAYMIDLLSKSLDTVTPTVNAVDLVFAAERFALRMSSSTPGTYEYPFIVAQVPGQPAGTNAVFMNTAYIKEGTITNLMVQSLAVDKITAGNLSVAMNFTTGGLAKSNNYSAGIAGWQIKADGTFQFNKDVNTYFKYDGTNFAFKGVVIFTSGSGGYANLSDRPTSLNGISSGEYNTLIAASTNAANAITAASDAQTAANAANAALTDIASDSLLTPDEKPRVIQDRDVIVAEQTGIDTQASAYSITSEKTAYDNAVAALVAYLATLTTPVSWYALNGNTTIVGATFRQKFADVYATRQTLLNAIAAKAKALADAAQSTANTAASNASTAITNAATANALLADIASDAKLTAVEKQAVQTEWNVIVAEKAGIDTQADDFGITRTTYDANYTTLSNYLSPLLANLTTTSDITAATFRDNFKNYYTERTAILNAIAQASSNTRKNLVQNAGFSVMDWEINTVGGTTVTWGLNYTSWCVPGYGCVYCQEMTRVAGSYSEIKSRLIAVRGGTRYEFYAYIGAHRTTAQVFVYFYDAAGAVITNSTLYDNASYVGGVTVGTFKQAGGFVTSPANAVGARLIIRKNATDSGQTNSFLFGLMPYFGLALASQTVLSTWDLGPASFLSMAEQWVRPGQTTIDGNKIYTGDAYVDTLQIKGQAVTFPMQASRYTQQSATGGSSSSGSLSITSTASVSNMALSGASTLIQANMSGSAQVWTHNYSGCTWSVRFVILDGSTEVYSFYPQPTTAKNDGNYTSYVYSIARNIMITPSAGTHSFSLKLVLVSTETDGDSTIYIDEVSLLVMEVKR
jgi:hypothetical protein